MSICILGLPGCGGEVAGILIGIALNTTLTFSKNISTLTRKSVFQDANSLGNRQLV